MESRWFNDLAGIALILGVILAVSVPIGLVIFIAKRIKDRRYRNVFLLASMAAPFVLLYIYGFLGFSTARVERDHSINLPRSASVWYCGDGIFSMTTFEDVGAWATFEISREDLPKFLSQFSAGLSVPPAPESEETGVSYLSAPSGFGQVIATFRGISRDGNVMTMDVHDLDTSRVGVCISTCWN